MRRSDQSDRLARCCFVHGWLLAGVVALLVPIDALSFRTRPQAELPIVGFNAVVALSARNFVQLGLEKGAPVGVHPCLHLLFR